MSAASIISSSDVDIERALLNNPGRAEEEEEESKVEPPAARCVPLVILDRTRLLCNLVQ